MVRNCELFRSLLSVVWWRTAHERCLLRATLSINGWSSGEADTRASSRFLADHVLRITANLDDSLLSQMRHRIAC
jgi:hypothetical protein